MPRVMPMTAAIAPAFAERYPEPSIIFDNLHSMHDVISDILANPAVPREKKREEILRAAERYRDDTSFLMTMQEWREMGTMMGIENMGGPAVGFLPTFPQPTVPRGSTMAQAMAGMGHGAGAQGATHTGTQHGVSSGGHAGENHAPQPAHTAETTGSAPDVQRMMMIHERMMADPVIRERVASDPELQRIMRGMNGASAPDSAHGSAAASDSARAIDFAVRLLSDPEVEARVHADPRLHRLWSDPEVQRRLAELRRQRGVKSAPAQQHQH
jgi:hypothetical protein